MHFVHGMAATIRDTFLLCDKDIGYELTVWVSMRSSFHNYHFKINWI